MPAIHTNPYSFSGSIKDVGLNVATVLGSPVAPGADYSITDYWDRVKGNSWQAMPLNLDVIAFKVRLLLNPWIPQDDNALYGTIGGLNFIVHKKELVLSYEDDVAAFLNTNHGAPMSSAQPVAALAIQNYADMQTPTGDAEPFSELVWGNDRYWRNYPRS